MTHFEFRHEAIDYLTDTIFPEISARVRLFKTPRQKQDEYVVISRDWLGDDVFQSYALERDIVDRLAADGVPPTITYDTVVGKKAVRAPIKTLAAWRRLLDTQAERLIGLCYLPGQPLIVERRLNTYLDVSVPAASVADVHEMLDHLHDNLCSKNTSYYTYVMNWLAHLVQKPQERPMAGIAIIGGQGTGKGIFIEFLKRMLGGSRNVNSTASAEDTKGFNYALGNKLLVVFDEATFSGDRKQADFMKKLVTEARIRIEQKGLDAYEVDNFARVIITSNNMQSAVPATIGARRWLIIECQNDLSQTELAAFVGRMQEPGMIESFKQCLESIDISQFDPTKLPQQNTGFETKLHNHYKEDPMYAFLCEWIAAPSLCLHRMRTEHGKDGIFEYDEVLSWEERVPFSTFYAIFKECCLTSFGHPPGPNRMRSLLAPYNIKIQAGTGNIREVHLPTPLAVLKTLERSARFDLLVSDEQREYIGRHWQYVDRTQRLASEGPPAARLTVDQQVAVVTARLSTPEYAPDLSPIPNEPVDEDAPWFIDTDGGGDWLQGIQESSETTYNF